MEFNLKVDCDNAAFADVAAELRTIMMQIADKIEGGRAGGHAVDSNGNVVGGWSLDEEADEVNEDQDEAENLAINDEHLYNLGMSGDEAGLEAAFREYVASNRLCDVDPDNVDYEALVAFVQS